MSLLLRIVLLGLGLVVSGCVRGMEPEIFACADDGDCRSGERCFISAGSGTCRSPDYCDSSDSCSQPAVCVDHACQAVECTASMDEACRPYFCVQNSCGKSCASDGECRDNLKCEDQRCVPAKCTDEDAGATCLGQACKAGLCASSCLETNRCALGYSCNESSGDCTKDVFANGETCDLDLQCESGSCCPTATPSERQCQPNCLPLKAESACSWDEVCESGECKDGICACTTAACRNAICGATECGTVNGYSCGTCADREYCDAGQCQDACGSYQCGLVHGVSCGTCTGTSYCSDVYQCEDACAGFECGEHVGFQCGTCDSDHVCNGVSCIEPVCPVDKAKYCKGGNSYNCYGGTFEFLADTCNADEYCDEDSGYCAPYLCQAGKDFCNGEVFSTCDSTRLGVLPGARDCAAESLDCTLLGCGQREFEGTGYCSAYVTTIGRVGNIYLASTNTTLLRFGQAVKGVSGVLAYFRVYESTTEAGTYTVVASSSVTSDGNDGVTYSPVLNTPIVAGRYYLLALENWANSGGFKYCYSGSGGSVQTLSFGTRLTRSEYKAAGGGPFGTIVAPSGNGPTLQYVETVTLQ